MERALRARFRLWILTADPSGLSQFNSLTAPARRPVYFDRKIWIESVSTFSYDRIPEVNTHDETVQLCSTLTR